MSRASIQIDRIEQIIASFATMAREAFLTLRLRTNPILSVAQKLRINVAEVERHIARAIYKVGKRMTALEQADRH